MKNIQPFLIGILCTCIFSCTDKLEDLKKRERNPNIVSLEQGGANAVWLTDSTICAMPLSVTTLDKNLKTVQYKRLGNETGIPLSYNKEKNKILYVQGGSLYEYDFGINHVKTIFYNANVRGAHYYKDDKIIYCGNYLDTATHEIKNGLCMYDQSTRENNFIRPIGDYFRTSRNPQSVSGFDIHPQQNKLLFYEDGFMVEYDMNSKQSEKIYAVSYYSTWFRYNPSGNKIVYSSDNGIEILDLTTMKNNVLNTNTAIYENDISTDIYPCWSPNGKNIIYGSSHSEGIDQGQDRLYILKNAD